MFGNKTVRNWWLFTIGVLLLAVVVAAVLWRKDTPSPLVVPPAVFSYPDSSVTLQEDDPGWDCGMTEDGCVTYPSLPTTGTHVHRADWAHAFEACRATGEYTVPECVESVNDGEF